MMMKKGEVTTDFQKNNNVMVPSKSAGGEVEVVETL